MSSSTTQTNDNDPMQVRHGRALWRDLVATKAGTEAILDILTPAEESPVLDSLVRIEAALATLLAVLLPPSGSADGR
jgi:hypothetical protein